MKTRCRNAFTLIEVLIVVVIMAVLAATIIPQFSSSTKDAQESSVKFNANTMRAQLELYKAHHLGKYPTVANFVDQMTKSTNASGTVGAAGPDFPFGPYMQEVPANPFNNLRTIVAGTGGAGTGAGWQYDESTGNIYPDHAGYSGGTSGTTTIN